MLVVSYSNFFPQTGQHSPSELVSCSQLCKQGWSNTRIIRGNLCILSIPNTLISASSEISSAVVDKIGDKTAILRKYDISTKILFCRHNNVPFWKRNYSFKKQNIDKISLPKGLTACKKRCKWVQRHAWCSASRCLPGQSRWSIALI